MLSALLTSPAPATQSPGASRERSAGDLQVAGRVRAPTAAGGSRPAPTSYGPNDLQGLKRLIIDKTEGNPFFIEEIVQALFERGALARNGAVRLTRPLGELKLPPTVQGILAARIDRLSAETKELLQTLAVIGKEFPLGLIERVLHPHPPGAAPGGLSRKRTGEAPEELERMLSSLQLGEFIYEQPAVGEVEYTFKHALTQEVAYNSMLAERRKQLHRRAAMAIEDLHANRLEDQYEELARHYDRAGDNPKAVHYLQLAGRQAYERLAYQEANAYVARGLELLAALPQGRARDQQEIRLRLVLGRVLGLTKGNRARRSELQRARQLIEEALATSQPASISQHARELCSFGQNLSYAGELTRARQVIEQAIALLESQPKSTGLGLRTHAIAHVLASRVCWMLGFPELALKRSREALALAQRSHDPLALALARGVGSEVHFHCDQLELLRQRVDALVAHLSECELPPLHAGRAKILQGWLLTRQGDHDEGVRLAREGLALTRVAGGRIVLPFSHYVWPAHTQKRVGSRTGSKRSAKRCSLCRRWGNARSKPNSTGSRENCS